jgi:hypothetical protein
MCCACCARPTPRLRCAEPISAAQREPICAQGVTIADFQQGTPPADADSGSNPADDGMIDVLEDLPDDPVPILPINPLIFGCDWPCLGLG